MLTTQDIKTAVSRYWSGRARDLTCSQAMRRSTRRNIRPGSICCGRWLARRRSPSWTWVWHGLSAMRMAELSHTAVGIDLAEEMLAIAQSKAAVRVASDLPARRCRAPRTNRAPYDVILERHVIWTLPQPRRQCAPGGSCSSLAVAGLIEGIFEMSDRTVYPDLEASCPLCGRPGKNWRGCSRGRFDRDGRQATDGCCPVARTPTRPRFMVTGRRPSRRLYAGLIGAPGLMLRASIDLVGVAEPYTWERSTVVCASRSECVGPGMQSVCRRPRRAIAWDTSSVGRLHTPAISTNWDGQAK